MLKFLKLNKIAFLLLYFSRSYLGYVISNEKEYRESAVAEIIEKMERNRASGESSLIQWNPDFTIWQGDSKLISLNRDIVVNELPIYK